MVVEARVVLYGALSIAVVSSLFSILQLLVQLREDRCWLSGLRKDDLLKDENELQQCLRKYRITQGNSSAETLIKRMSYEIKETPFLFFREAYTSNKPYKRVVVKKGLSTARRNFALSHELMHIIYKPEELLDAQRSRGIHHTFIKRDDDEQKRDYMAASLIMPSKTIWEKLEACNYFQSSKNIKKQVIYSLADEYNVEPRAVIRRIHELQTMNG